MESNSPITVGFVFLLIMSILAYFMKQKDSSINKAIDDVNKKINKHEAECTVRNENHARLEGRFDSFMQQSVKAQEGIDKKFETIADRLMDIGERLPKLNFESELRESFKDFQNKMDVVVNNNRIDISNLRAQTSKIEAEINSLRMNRERN